MGRRTRQGILYDGCYGHIYSRALEHRSIFQEAGDFEMFKKLLSETKEKFGYRIHHYCLMNTHFHLLVSLDVVDRFSKAVKELYPTTSQTVILRSSFRKAEGLSGIQDSILDSGFRRNDKIAICSAVKYKAECILR